MFDEPTRKAAQENLRGFGDTFAGRGQAVGRTLEELPRFMQSLEPVMATLAEPETDLDGFVKELGDAARIVAPVSEQNAQLFTGMADTFEALGRDEQALKDLIAKSPPTMDTGIRSFQVQRPFLTDLTAFSKDFAGATEELKGALPPLNDAVRVGTPVQRRLPTLNEETAKTLVQLRKLAEAPGTNAALRGLTATVTTLNPQLRFYGPYVTVCNSFNYFFTYLAEHFSEPDTTGSAQRALVNLDRPPGGLARLDGRRRAGQRRGRDRGHAAVRAGPAVRRRRRARRARRLRGRPARLRRARRALLPVQVQDRARPALARPAGPDLRRPPARARGPDLHRRARDRRVRRHAEVGAPMSRRSNTTIGLIALAVIDRRRAIRLDQGDPAASRTTRSRRRSRAPTTSGPARRSGSPASRSARSPASSARAATGAILTMRIDDKGRPVHSDATAKIRPRIFLEGNFFVDLTAGSPSTPELDDGATMPVQQTATPVQLDEVLTALQSDTREDLKILLREYGTALEGAGARGFNRSLPYWEPAYRDSAIVGEAMLGETGHDLSGYVEHAGATAEALDRNREQLKSLITDFHTTAHAFAVQEANLRTAVGELPNTLNASMPALQALNESFPPLRSLASELRPGVQSSEETLDASLPFVQRAARPRLRARAARPGRRPAPDRARPRRADRPQHPALPPGPPRGELPEHRHPPVVDGHGARQAVPGPGQGLRGGAQAAARPRRREPLGRRQRLVVPRAGRRRQEPRHAAARRVRHHARAADRRQPAAAGEAPADRREEAV